MDTLLTWSGGASHEIATFFHSWLPTVLPGIKPWISDQDIAKGKKWFPELTAQLDKSHVSITFITPENVRSPWVYYEVGFIAAKLESGFVCPYIMGVDSKLVKDTPLGQFQWTLAEKDDTWKLIKSINGYMEERRHDETLIEAKFNAQWTKLKRQIDKVVDSLGEVEKEVTETEFSIEEQLSEEARTLITEASNDPSGRIGYFQSMDGTDLSTNGKNYTEDKSPRNVSIWKGALEELRDSRLVDDVGYEGELFTVSRKGYEVAERIKSRVPRQEPDAEIFASLEELMPDLLNDLRTNLTEHPLLRNMVVLKYSTYAYDFDEPHLKFGNDTLPGVTEKVRILLDHGLLTEQKKDFWYRITERFAKYLRKQ